MFSRKIYLFIAIAVVMFASSCSKNNDTTPTTTVTVAQSVADNSLSASVYGEIDAQQSEDVSSLDISGFQTSGVLKSGSVSGTRTITVSSMDTTTFPKTITITFNNWVGPRGHVKNGTIVSVLTNRWFISGATLTTTFQDFTLDSIKVEGSYECKNIGNYTFTRSLSGGKLTKKNGTIINHEFTHTWTMISGMDTRYAWDDVFEVEGSGSGSSSNGASYTEQIITPLNVAVLCPWIRSGIVKYTAENISATVDYGDGQCDNLASVTIGSLTYPIVLHSATEEIH
jgi:hypothetical protein